MKTIGFSIRLAVKPFLRGPLLATSGVINLTDGRKINAELGL